MNKILAISLSSTMLAAAALFAVVTESATSHAPAAFSQVANPDVPASMKFFDKTVDLDRTDMWERFDRELTSMIYTHGNTLLTIKRANKLFPRIIPILKANNMPDDIIYLACIESSLDQRAYSSAKAAGIWQFIPSAAQQYGLEITDEVDERYNIEKATAAACKFLKNSYAKFGNWESAMAAFNCGPARVTKELDAQGENSSFDLYLNRETSRYVFRIMAMKAIMENPRAYGFSLSPSQLYQPVVYKDVNVSTSIADWAAWAKRQGISYAQLVEANPWIRDKKLTNPKGKTYTVKVPTKDSLSRSKQKISVYNKNWVN